MSWASVITMLRAEKAKGIVFFINGDTGGIPILSIEKILDESRILVRRPDNSWAIINLEHVTRIEYD